MSAALALSWGLWELFRGLGTGWLGDHGEDGSPCPAPPIQVRTGGCSGWCVCAPACRVHVRLCSAEGLAQSSASPGLSPGGAIITLLFPQKCLATGVWMESQLMVIISAGPPPRGVRSLLCSHPSVCRVGLGLLKLSLTFRKACALPSLDIQLCGPLEREGQAWLPSFSTMWSFRTRMQVRDSPWAGQQSQDQAGQWGWEWGTRGFSGPPSGQALLMGDLRGAGKSPLPQPVRVSGNQPLSIQESQVSPAL